MKTKYGLLLGLVFLLIVPVYYSVAIQQEDTRTIGASVITAKKPTPPPPTPTGGSPITGQKYALCIGISDYSGTSNDLQYCDDDARDWATYLQSQGYSVTLLLDSQATKANILAAIQNLANLENEVGDAVVITYSGHGSYSRTSAQSMLVAWELVGVYENDIELITDTFQSQHVYFFDDACLQGTMQNLGNSGWVLAIGSTTKTYTYDGDASMANGIFTYYAMEALYTMGYTTAEAVSSYAVTQFNAETSGAAFWIDGYTIGDWTFT